MTFSIVAYDPETASWGVAVASKFLAVGAVVPWGRAGAGALATQAIANLAYGPEGLALLASGMSAADAAAQLTGADSDRDLRQLGIVDASGRAATFTGDLCLDWAGGRVDDEVTAQGNILVGPEVVEDMITAYRAEPAAPFARKLLAALVAGDRAGGDRRGRQGASLRVWRAGGSYGGKVDIAIDLRVDDHADPVVELARLLGLHDDAMA